MPRALKVCRAGEEIGYLGEGPGPFISSAHSVLEHPQLETTRYTSLDVLEEGDISEVLTRVHSFDEAARELVARGFELLPVSYDDVFVPPGSAAPTSAVAKEEHEHGERELRRGMEDEG